MKVTFFKKYTFLGTGIKRLHCLTEEGATLKGIGFFIFNFRVLDFCLSNEEWTDDEGNPYGIAIEDKRSLFIGRLVIKLF